MENAPRPKDIESVDGSHDQPTRSKGASSEFDRSTDLAVELREWKAVTSQLDGA